MGNRTRDRLEKALREIRTARARQLQVMARLYPDTAKRLASAYQNILPAILQAIQAPLKNQTKMEAAIQDELARLDDLILSESRQLQLKGLEAGYRLGIRVLQAGGMNVQFNALILENIQAAINYVDKPAFIEAVTGYAPYHADKVRDLIISGVARGNNPRLIAGLIKDYFQNSKRPLIDAENLTRTTMVYSLREGARGIYQQSGVTEWVWISALDDRTCAMCISQHGSFHPITELLNDHHRGRCAAGPVTPSWKSLGINAEDEVIETGPSWFMKQPIEVQKQILGNKVWESWQAGKFEFKPEVMTTTYNNPIFGPMRRRRAWGEILQD